MDRKKLHIRYFGTSLRLERASTQMVQVIKKGGGLCLSDLGTAPLVLENLSRIYLMHIITLRLVFLLGLHAAHIRFRAILPSPQLLSSPCREVAQNSHRLASPICLV